MTFITSLAFLYAMLGVSAALVTIAVLGQNISWTARGITPPDQVEALKKSLPSLRKVGFVLGALGVAALLVWFIGIIGDWAGKQNQFSFSEFLRSPSLSTIAAFGAAYWLWVLLFGLISYGIIETGKESWTEKLVWAKKVIVYTLVVLGVLVFVPKGWSYIKAPFSTPRTPAPVVRVLAVNADGSSEVVRVPEGQVPCFDSWMWRSLDRVGLMTSYGRLGIPETPFACSAEEVLSGSCRAVYDRFYFKPSAPTVLLNYWFVSSGAKQC